MEKKKYLWLTDTHVTILNRHKLLNVILDQKPAAVFLTGDISNSSSSTISTLEFLGRRIGRPLYFVLGNHDLHFSDRNSTFNEVRSLCKTYKNLTWMTDNQTIQLSEQSCLIGHEGFYDARVGNPDYIKFTLDWLFIKDTRDLPSMKERIEMLRSWSEESITYISKKLEESLSNYKSVYLLTHFPPFTEASRCYSIIGDQFWHPYNTNYGLGQALEKIMEKYKKRNLTVLCGHVHQPVQIHAARNIECRVGRGSYHKISEEEILFI